MFEPTGEPDERGYYSMDDLGVDPIVVSAANAAIECGAPIQFLLDGQPLLAVSDLYLLEAQANGTDVPEIPDYAKIERDDNRRAYFFQP